MAVKAQPDIEKAEDMARRAHRGQNYGGKPYITHVEAVVNAAKKLDAVRDVIIVAWLHDVIEDSASTNLDEIAKEFSPVVANAVEAITKREDESYKEYLIRAAQNPIAAKVKLCDIEANLAASRRLVAKYEDALIKFRANVANKGR